LTDDLIRGIAEGDGVVGFHALDAFISTEPDPTLEDLLRHIAHIAEVGGTDCIGIGPDLMEKLGSVDFHHRDRPQLDGQRHPGYAHEMDLPKRMQSNAEPPNLTEGLLKLGFSSQDVTKFLGGNFMRVFDAVWKPRGANSL
jgi:membrane dipeptidase